MSQATSLEVTLTEQMEAMLHGAAFVPLTGINARGFLRIAGPDATRWLNGMVTNHVAALAPGDGNYNFLLNAQGRIQGDATIFREPGEAEPAYLLETDAAQLETLHQLLDRFIIMDDVTLTAQTTEATGRMLVGPEAPMLLTAMGLPALQPLHMARVETAVGQALLLAPASAPVPRYEVFAAASLDVAGAVEASPEALEAFRIYAGLPRYGTDIRNTETARDLPQETGQSQALHFAKGCYLGQEIVERIRSRGQVHRQFTQFRLTGEGPSLPAPLESGGKIVGELTSAAAIPLKEGRMLAALGYLRREAQGSGELTYAGGTAMPQPPKA